MLKDLKALGKITCPFCFSAFAPDSVLFRCIQPYPRCTGWADDTRYAQKRNLPITKMGYVFEEKASKERRIPIMSVPRSATCDICFATSYTHLCPECHFELPHDVGQMKQRIIAIIGGTGTGKSHYIGSLIFTLKGNQCANLVVTLLADDTQTRWNNDFYTPVFVNKTVLPGTQKAEVDARVRAPLVMRLTSKENAWQRKMAGQDQAINTSIFDSAGEDVADFNTLSVEDLAIVHADGLIFMIDPLQIDSVLQQLPGVKAAASDPRSHPDNLLGRLIKLFETQGNVKAGSGKIPIPTAFVLSKVDMLESIVGSGATFLQPSTHDGGLNYDEVQSVSTEVDNYLRQWLLPSFGDTIKQRFASYGYFGVSALGRQPSNHRQLEVVGPLRVEEPFLWLLYQMGFVKKRSRA